MAKKPTAKKNTDAGTPKPDEDISTQKTTTTDNSDSSKTEDSSSSNSDDSSKNKSNSTTAKKDGSINVVVEPEKPKEFTPKLRDLMDKSMNLSRMSEQGLINEKNGAAVVVREDGIISLSSSKDAYLRLTPQGRCVTTSFENVHISNRETIRTDEVVINDHKLNPQLWELTNFKETSVTNNQHVYVGNLCMCGSVLVKAWEPNLKRYMLIRRPWRGPVFGTQMNVAEIMPALGITDPLKLNEDILALSEKGYQVNGAIKDKNSLIGKDGKDRPGVIRNVDAMGANGGTNTYGDVTATPLGKDAIAPAKAWETLRKFGYDAIATAGIMGNIRQESGFSPTAKNKYGYTGLCQWDPNTRWPRFVQKYPAPKCWDAGNQLAWIINEPGYNTTKPNGMNGKFSTAADAAIYFLDQYEGARGQEEENRKAYATDFYSQFKDKK